MAALYLDNNRGSEVNNGLTPSTPKKLLSNMFNFLPGAGGGIYLANDSYWEMPQTVAVNGVSTQTQFNGAAGNPAIITGYNPPGVGSSSSKPTIRRRYVPVAGDWAWDSTLNFGVAKGWYVQLGWNLDFWDVWIKAGGAYAITTNQSTTNNTGLGFINGEQVASASAGVGDFVNGMGYDTLRFNLDYGGLNVGGSTFTRLYLSGLGLRTPGAGNDPSSVYGPGQIAVGFSSPVFSFYGCGNYVDISGIRVEQGSGLMLLQAPDNTVINGFKLHDCESEEAACLMRVNTGSGTVAGTYYDIDVYSNNTKRMSGPTFKGFGPGLVGYFRNNIMTTNNLTGAIGGSVYCQLQPSTYTGTKTPFQVKGNTAQYALNGVGNCTFDGGCYYADIYDTGTVFSNNIAKDSYFAMQCGSGGQAWFIANISINCETFGTFNNAPAVRSGDYNVLHNVHYAAKRGTFQKGQGIVHLYAFGAYQTGGDAEMVAGRICNNVFVNHPEGNASERPILAYSDALWAAGKITVKNNLAIGYNSTRQCVADFDAVNKTSSAAMLPISTATGFVNSASNDFRLTGSSGLISAGYEMARPRGVTDLAGVSFYNPPSVGAYEVPRMPDYFGLRTRVPA